MKNISKTDWDKVTNIPDASINLSDIPEMDETFWEDAEWYLPPKQDSLVHVLKRYHLDSKDIQIVVNLIKRLAH